MTSEQEIDLVEFILQSMRTTVSKVKEERLEARVHSLDDRLFGCVQLPEDFDYDKELDSAMNEKYGH